MHKLLTKLENSKSFWFLLVISIIFFTLRLPSLIEPNWYGDEGIYQVIGNAMNEGRMLYAEIFDNKPPLLYVTYALLGGDQYLVRLASLITGIFAIGFFFYLSRSVVKKLIPSIIATATFAVLFGLPVLEGNIANAENFMLPLIIASAMIVYRLTEKKLSKNEKTNLLFISGLLLGFAFLFKIVAIFDFGAFLIFLLALTFPEKISNRKIISTLLDGIKKLLPFVSGFLLPLSIAIIYFAVNNALSDFIIAAFSANINYVGWKNSFVIPQGFLIFKSILLILFTAYIFVKRTKITKPIIFVLLWLGFSLFNTFFSGRPYTHYTLLSLPVLSLLTGLIFSVENKKFKYILATFLIISISLIVFTFRPDFKKTADYYQNTISFLTHQKDVDAYQAFFDHKTPRDYALSSFIRQRTGSDDNIFIWGDSAQIYTLSDKLPPGKYTVAYHISQYPSALEKTQIAINTKRPKYIISLKEAGMVPFSLPNYSLVFSFEGSNIYERDY